MYEVSECLGTVYIPHVHVVCYMSCSMLQLRIETTDGDITTVAVKMPYKHPNDVSKIIPPLIVKFACMDICMINHYRFEEDYRHYILQQIYKMLSVSFCQMAS